MDTRVSTPRFSLRIRRLALAPIFVLVACVDPGDNSPRRDDASIMDDVADEAHEAVPDVKAEDLPELPPDDAANEVCPEILLPTEPPVSEAEVVCVPGRTATCTCRSGGPGFRACDGYGEWGTCLCDDMLVIRDTEEGMHLHGPPIVPPPRLVAPLSGRRTTSRRPTLRWVLPEGMTRARVELCDDRRCTRRIAQVDVTGTSWRPEEVIRPGVVFWRVSGLREDGSVGWTSATWEFGVRRRDTPVDTIGRPFKDFNRDGYDDVLLQYDRLGVMLGSRNGGRPAPFLIDNQVEWYSFGDMNGDGYADLVTGSDQVEPGWSTTGAGWRTSDTADGAVRVHFGSPGCPLRQSRRIFQPALGVTNYFGREFALGDFDGDGFDDLLVGFVEGLAFYKGSPDGPSSEPADIVRVTNGEYFFSAGVTVGARMGMRMIGDVDRDGYADLAASSFSPGDVSGMVQVFYGNHEGRISARVQTLTSHRRGDLGNHVVGADFTGDGLSDLVVSAYNEFHLFAGTPDGLRRISNYLLPSAFAHTMPEVLDLCPSGDLNGDGLADLFIDNSSIYRSFGVAGFGGAPTVNTSFAYLSSPGDLDGDGVDDLLAFPRIAGASLFFRGGAFQVGAPLRIWGFSPTVCNE